MKTKEAQRRFNEIIDEWRECNETAQGLRVDAAQSFADVAKGGVVNPSLDLLAALESIEQKERQLRAKIDEIIKSIDD